MRISQRIRMTLICVITLAFNITLRAASISIGYSDTPFALTIQGSGSGFASSATTYRGVAANGSKTILTSDGYWSFVINVTEDPHFFVDFLTISGNTVHVKPPPGTAHTNDGVGTGNPYSLFVDSGKAMQNIVRDTESGMANHGPHLDDWTGTLTANVHPSAIGVADITGFDFVIQITHCTPPQKPDGDVQDFESGGCPLPATGPFTPVDVEAPEPANFVLMAPIAVVLGLRRLRRAISPSR